MKIVVLDGYATNPGDLSWDKIEAFGDLTVYDRTPVEKTLERIKDADIVFVNKAPVSREDIEGAKNLKYIGVLATGYNIVDVEAAKDNDVIVTNIPTYGTDSVAQFSIALLLEVCHHIGHHGQRVQEGAWAANPDWTFWDFPLIELSGKTMGVIGYGRIGRRVGEIAKALGMDVIAYGEKSKGEEYVEADEFYERADIISLHAPLTADNEKMINKETIGKMKDGVIIVNTARGQLIDEEDLTEALNVGKVAAAALDVVSVEPIEDDNPLLKAKNCIITPHIAWAPKEARVRIMIAAEENLKAFLDGKPIHTV